MRSAEIIAAVNALRVCYDYLFTTGGIGPTHDDITAGAVAAALGVGISEDPRAIKFLLERIKPKDLNEARRRMALIPHGATLIENKISKAPGFWIANVIVMAGVPAIMQAMLDDVAPKLATGTAVVAETISAGSLFEGTYAAALGEFAAANPELSIGSYPAFRDGGFHNEIVVRGKVPGKCRRGRGGDPRYGRAARQGAGLIRDARRARAAIRASPVETRRATARGLPDPLESQPRSSALAAPATPRQLTVPRSIRAR